MTEKWKQVYSEMIRDIGEWHEVYNYGQEQIGKAYKVALKYWEQVKTDLRTYKFRNEKEEIEFYKNVKPKFTGFIVYLMLVNYALVFMPCENLQAQQTYWQDEMKRLGRFIKKNKAFVEYYKSGRTGHDFQYFLSAPEEHCYSFLKIYDTDGEFVSSHDHLVASLLGEEMYHKFASYKLQIIKKHF